MGDKYTNVVMAWLICLNSDNEDFGEEREMLDEGRVLVGVWFIEKVLIRLGEIPIFEMKETFVLLGVAQDLLQCHNAGFGSVFGGPW